MLLKHCLVHVKKQSVIFIFCSGPKNTCQYNIPLPSLNDSRGRSKTGLVPACLLFNVHEFKRFVRKNFHCILEF